MDEWKTVAGGAVIMPSIVAGGALASFQTVLCTKAGLSMLNWLVKMVRWLRRPVEMVQVASQGSAVGPLGDLRLADAPAAYRTARNRAADRAELFGRGVRKPVGFGKAARRRKRG